MSWGSIQCTKGSAKSCNGSSVSTNGSTMSTKGSTTSTKGRLMLGNATDTKAQTRSYELDDDQVASIHASSERSS